MREHEKNNKIYSSRGPSVEKQCFTQLTEHMDAKRLHRPNYEKAAVPYRPFDLVRTQKQELICFDL